MCVRRLALDAHEHPGAQHHRSLLRADLCMRVTNTVSRAHHPSEGERIDDNGTAGRGGGSRSTVVRRGGRRRRAGREEGEGEVGRRGLAGGGRGSVTVTSSRAHSRGRAIGRSSEYRFQSRDLGAENWTGQRFHEESTWPEPGGAKIIRPCVPAQLPTCAAERGTIFSGDARERCKIGARGQELECVEIFRLHRRGKYRVFNVIRASFTVTSNYTFSSCTGACNDEYVCCTFSLNVT